MQRNVLLSQVAFVYVKIFVHFLSKDFCPLLNLAFELLLSVRHFYGSKLKIVCEQSLLFRSGTKYMGCETTVQLVV